MGKASDTQREYGWFGWVVWKAGSKVGWRYASTKRISERRRPIRPNAQPLQLKAKVSNPDPGSRGQAGFGGGVTIGRPS